MNDFMYYMPVRVYFGQGGVKKHLARELEKYGKNIMVVYGGGSVKRSGIFDEVTSVLKECGKNIIEFGGVLSNPTYEKVQEGIALYKENNVDLMIALGGGSVVDCTKIMAAGAEIEGDIWTEEFENHHFPETMGKYAVILTISGAGAEMDHLGACTSEARQEKRTFVGPYAQFVIEDPSYLMSVPLKVFTPGVYDSLSHCMESYFGIGFNVWDEINESLMKNIVTNGRALMETPDSMEIRSNLMWDSSLIQSFSFYMGKPGDFQAHGMENMLAARTHGTHGVQLAILQPAYYDRIVEGDPAKFARFAEKVFDVDPNGKDDLTVAKEGIQALRDFIKTLQLPATFAEAGIEVTEETAKATSEICSLTTTNARQLTREEIYEIILSCR